MSCQIVSPVLCLHYTALEGYQILLYATAVARPTIGQNAKSATSGTCTDTNLGLITVLGVIDSESRYLTALGKLLRGHLGPMIDLRKVRQVDQNGPNGKTPGFDPG